ncbi:MAG: acyl-CoA thioesterase [Papillibacter sp.]|jgi:acyl-CoA thioester hydrolase|nr:acyl-CoA thioesterase [Papillibacter sp.]
MTTKTIIETRYPECDRMGIIHHAVYPIWYEMARMDWFEAAGFSFADMNALGVNPAMVDLHIQYKAAAGYPQKLYILTKAGQYAPKKLELLYEMYTEDGKLINSATTFHIWTGPDNRSYNLEENLPDIYEKIKKAAM